MWIFVLFKIIRLVKGGEGQDLYIVSMFRIEFSICEWPLRQKTNEILPKNLLKGAIFPFLSTSWINFSKHLYSLYVTVEYIELKGCVGYIFTSLFCMPKGELFCNERKCYLFHFESSLYSWDNHILAFQIFKRHAIIKC